MGYHTKGQGDSDSQDELEGQKVSRLHMTHIEFDRYKTKMLKIMDGSHLKNVEQMEQEMYNSSAELENLQHLFTITKLGKKV